MVQHSRASQRLICVLSLHWSTQKRLSQRQRIDRGPPAASYRCVFPGQDSQSRTPVPQLPRGRVHGLPPAADGGGGRARERRAGLGGAQLAAGKGTRCRLRASDCARRTAGHE